MTNREKTWAAYTSSWKAQTPAEKRAIFAETLHKEFIYSDPLTTTRGWDALIDYMVEFHRQVEGGHFVTIEFITHHDRSMAKWKMLDGKRNTIGDGVSIGEYDDTGILVAATGFYQTP